MTRQVQDCDALAPLEVEFLTGGRSNVTYRLRQGDRSWVLRRPPLGHVMATAHDMSREFKVLRALEPSRFPSPKALALCEDVSVTGAPFMIMEHVDGLVISDAAEARTLSRDQADSLSSALVDTLVQLHAVDISLPEVAELGRPQGFVPRQVRRWGEQWETTRTRPRPDLDSLRSWLVRSASAVPEVTDGVVVHGDYRLDNILLDRSSLQPAAVIDWEMATLGDPVADLAVALVYWSSPGDELRRVVPVAEGVTEAPGFWSRTSLVDAYRARSGRALPHLDYCIALACFKLAVIMESIHYRNLEGQQLGSAGGEAGIAMGDAPDALAALGLAVARGGGVAALGR